MVEIKSIQDIEMVLAGLNKTIDDITLVTMTWNETEKMLLQHKEELEKEPFLIHITSGSPFFSGPFREFVEVLSYSDFLSVVQAHIKQDYMVYSDKEHWHYSIPVTRFGMDNRFLMSWFDKWGGIDV